MTNAVTSEAHDARSIRDRLIEAAESVLDEVGEARLTLAQVVRRAGLTTGAVYSNFENREELIVAVYLRDFEGLLIDDARRLREVFESDLTGQEFLDALFTLVVRPDVEVNRQSRWVRLRAMAAAQRYDSVHQALSRQQRAIAEYLVETIERARARGDIASDVDARALALLIQEFAFGLVLSDLSEDLAPDADAWVAMVWRVIEPLIVPRQPRRV